MPEDDDKQDEIEREQGEAILRQFVEERKARDEAMHAALSAAVAEMEKENDDDDE